MGRAELGGLAAYLARPLLALPSRERSLALMEQRSPQYKPYPGIYTNNAQGEG